MNFIRKLIDTHTIVEYDSVSESDEDSDNELDFLRTLLYNNGNIKIYKCTARDIVPNVKLWGSQRSIRKKHVESLITSIKKANFLMGTFKLIRDNNSDVRCIDGQHRITALRKIMEDDPKFDTDIIIELYETDKIDSEYSGDLFKAANNTLNISECDMPNLGAEKIISDLMKHFPGSIIDSQPDTRVNRPRMNKNELYKHLKEKTKDLHWEDILENIKKFNTELGMKERPKHVSLKMLEKVKKSGFYIGTLKDLSWITTLTC
jgi:hypothetical protein